jgi:hypothetical protein
VSVYSGDKREEEFKNESFSFHLHVSASKLPSDMYEKRFNNGSALFLLSHVGILVGRLFDLSVLQ